MTVALIISIVYLTAQTDVCHHSRCHIVVIFIMAMVTIMIIVTIMIVIAIVFISIITSIIVILTFIFMINVILIVTSQSSPSSPSPSSPSYPQRRLLHTMVVKFIITFITFIIGTILIPVSCASRLYDYSRSLSNKPGASAPVPSVPRAPAHGQGSCLHARLARLLPAHEERLGLFWR